MMSAFEKTGRNNKLGDKEKQKTLSSFNLDDSFSLKKQDDGYIRHEEKIPRKENSGKNRT